MVCSDLGSGSKSTTTNNSFSLAWDRPPSGALNDNSALGASGSRRRCWDDISLVAERETVVARLKPPISTPRSVDQIA
jgi:hypothetical protein